MPGRGRPRRGDPRRPPAGGHHLGRGRRALGAAPGGDGRARRPVVQRHPGGVPRARGGPGQRDHRCPDRGGGPDLPRPARPAGLARRARRLPPVPAGRAAAGIRQRVAVRRAADSHADLSRLPAGQARARGRPDPHGHGGLPGRRGARGRGASGRELLRGARPSARGRPGGHPGPGPDRRDRQPGPDRVRRRSRQRVHQARLPVPARRGDHPRRQRGGRGLEPRADPGGGSARSCATAPRSSRG